MSNLNTVQNALPVEGVPATGVFAAVQNVVPDTYDTPTGLSDAPYNTVCIGDASSNVVGTPQTPYLPMALPSYIPTLYENVYRVQTSLKNVIPTTDVPDNREFPTIYAVKQYVASQLSGSEVLIPVPDQLLAISTGVNTSFLTANELEASPNVTALINPTTNITSYITTYGINQIDTARNGADKVCISISALGQITSTTAFYMQIVLTEPNQFFVVNGKTYKCYVFASLGDILNMTQFVRNTGENLFFVTTYAGLFSETAYYQTA
jgi:hypothetical protein